MNLPPFQEAELFIGDSLGKNWHDAFSYDFGHHYIDAIAKRDQHEFTKIRGDVYFWNQGNKSGIERGQNPS